MINGDETSENSREVTSPDPSCEFSPKSGNSDASPAQSHYSSCGESEYDRYCSANSAMGTPSLCSSLGTFHECLDSEFGSLKSFGLGDASGLENFSLGGRFVRSHDDQVLPSSGGFDCLDDRRLELCKGNIDDHDPGTSIELGDGSLKIRNGSNFYGYDDNSFLPTTTLATRGDTTLLNAGNGSKLRRLGDVSIHLDYDVCGEDGNGDFLSWREHGETGVSQSAAENVSHEAIMDKRIVEGNSCNSQFSSVVEEGSPDYMVAAQVDSDFDRLNSETNFQFDVRDTERLSAEDETSARCEHSEDEDSMYNYGADDGYKFDSCSGENKHCHQDVKTENRNPLVMNSSIAYGSEDWEDFMQETMETAVLNNFQEQRQEKIETKRTLQKSTSVTSSGCSSFGGLEQREDAGDIPLVHNQTWGANESEKFDMTYSVTMTGVPDFSELEQGNVPRATDQLGGTDDAAEYLESCTIRNIFEAEQESLKQKSSLEVDLNIVNGEHKNINAEKVSSIDHSQLSENQVLGKSTSQLDPLSNITISQVLLSTDVPGNNEAELFKGDEPNLARPTFENNIGKASKNSSKSVDFHEEQPVPTENLEFNQFYDEVVHEMEEILLDSGESPGSRFRQGKIMFRSHLSLPSRDGGATASTSGMDDAYSQIQHLSRIDGVEVVGAKQKRGDVSLGERLVGVKEYTVYKLRVWRGKDHWEVERRYRDFCTLYRQLKSFYADQDWILPSPWSSVERESRKIFGSASPDVIANRSALIQECLQSILHSRFSSSLPGPLIWFVSPQNSIPSSPASSTSPVPWFNLFSRGMDEETVTSFGKTISLIVENRPNKSMKQTLEEQQYACAGCHKYFDDGKTRIREFVQTFGWGKPRLCEYTGQLFCSSCHTNDSAVLPARVLHHWDFTQYPVSQLAKSYLDSIHDKLSQSWLKLYQGKYQSISLSNALYAVMSVSLVVLDRLVMIHLHSFFLSRKVRLTSADLVIWFSISIASKSSQAAPVGCISMWERAWGDLKMK
ncbi:uncharacterized protein LOC131146147 isoform X2 [Malania oleifera]|uniref:uncharacterized protein LOC131146147 isoform X2 n=1 Tax=Malania oleifera TaxID=397392 RepID=UPI0025AE40BD|nr:uncharacterized protein LOC131146147 isoform X2 [Malania oleifera]